MSEAAVSALHVYPVKSMGGISLPAAEVTARGLALDRRWMVTDAEGVFVTQREHPRLALCRVSVQPNALHIDAPGMPTLRVPLSPPPGERISVRVWRSVCDAVVVSEDADIWLSEYLPIPCNLVFMPDDTRRAQNPDYAAGEGIVSFADGYPLLVVSEASLADLNRRLDVPLPMNRFRPNVVAAHVPAYDEDTWARVQIGSVLFHGVKPCDRCAITAIDQDTAARGMEPLPTLAGYRRARGKVFFGQYLVPDAPGIVRVGDPIRVLTCGEPPLP